MTTTTLLHPIDWHACDEDGYPYYVTCDLCFENAATDIVAGIDIANVRGFWKQYGGDDDGLTVCGRCVEGYLREDGNE